MKQQYLRYPNGVVSPIFSSEFLIRHALGWQADYEDKYPRRWNKGRRSRSATNHYNKFSQEDKDIFDKCWKRYVALRQSTHDGEAMSYAQYLCGIHQHGDTKYAKIEYDKSRFQDETSSL